MARFTRWYGARPLHLLAFLASFGLAGYAALRFVSERPLAAALWFVGAAIGHDLLLLPLYQLADLPMQQLGRRQASPPRGPWINYLRFPLALSALLLLVWFPSILRLSQGYQVTTRLSSSGYFGRWLGVTGVLFGISAALFALRLRRMQRTSPPAGHPPAGPPRPAGNEMPQ